MSNTQIIEKQLKQVVNADLSNFDPETNTYYIPKRVDKKIEEDKCYLIRLKPQAFTNRYVIDNWNNGSIPDCKYLKIDVSRKMSKMIKVVSVGFDYEHNKDLSYFWNGWLSTDDIEVIDYI